MHWCSTNPLNGNSPSRLLALLTNALRVLFSTLKRNGLGKGWVLLTRQLAEKMAKDIITTNWEHTQIHIEITDKTESSLFLHWGNGANTRTNIKLSYILNYQLVSSTSRSEHSINYYDTVFLKMFLLMYKIYYWGIEWLISLEKVLVFFFLLELASLAIWG